MKTENSTSVDPNETNEQRAMRLWDTDQRLPQHRPPFTEERHLELLRDRTTQTGTPSPGNFQNPSTEQDVPSTTMYLSDPTEPRTDYFLVEPKQEPIDLSEEGLIQTFIKYYMSSNSDYEFERPIIISRFMEQMKTPGTYKENVISDLPVLLDFLCIGMATDIKLDKSIRKFRGDFIAARLGKYPSITGQIDAAAKLFDIALIIADKKGMKLTDFKTKTYARMLAREWVRQFDAAGWSLLIPDLTIHTDLRDWYLIEAEDTVKKVYIKFVNEVKSLQGLV